ncbi:MAG TPA: GspH/FimT family pseudopilin [Longimicrobiales bacterium]
MTRHAANAFPAEPRDAALPAAGTRHRSRGSGPSRARRPAGFTLAELVVVLLLLGVMAAVVVPALRAPAPDSAPEAARRIAAVLESARNAAVDRGVAVAVRFTAATGEYVVATAPWLDRAPETLGTGRLVLSPGATLHVVGRATTVFDPLRRARGGSIIVRNGEERYEVSVDHWTGDARIRR